MKDMVGYEDRYSITEDGRVWSKLSKKFLSLHKTDKGYLTFATKIGGRNGTYKCFKVHRLVAEAYIPNPENKPHVNHKDGNKENNSVDNLEWVTPTENMLHASSLGLLKSDRPKLTQEHIEFIKHNYVPGDTNYGARALGRMFGVNHSVILKVVST